MGMLMNRHVRVQQLKMIKKSIEDCDKRLDAMDVEAEKLLERKELLIKQLKHQEKSVLKEIDSREKALAVLKEKKEKADKKANDKGKMKSHPDSKAAKKALEDAKKNANKVPEQGEGDEVPLASMEMKKDELIEMASELELEIEDSMNKEQLVELINSSMEEKSEEEGNNEE